MYQAHTEKGKKCLSVLTYFFFLVVCHYMSAIAFAWHKMANHGIFYVLSHSNRMYLFFCCFRIWSFVYNSCANFPSVSNIQLIHSKSCLLFSSRVFFISFFLLFAACSAFVDFLNVILYCRLFCCSIEAIYRIHVSSLPKIWAIPIRKRAFNSNVK